MITLISSKKLGVYKIMRNTVASKRQQSADVLMQYLLKPQFFKKRKLWVKKIGLYQGLLQEDKSRGVVVIFFLTSKLASSIFVALTKHPNTHIEGVSHKDI